MVKIKYKDIIKATHHDIFNEVMFNSKEPASGLPARGAVLRALVTAGDAEDQACGAAGGCGSGVEDSPAG